MLGWRVTVGANICAPLEYGNGCTTTLPLEVFTQRNFVADFIRLKLNFILKNKKSLFEPPFLDLGVTYALHLSLIEKPVVDFIFVMVNFFRYLLRLRHYKQKSVEVGIFQRGVGHYECRFQREVGIAHQPLLVSE